MQEQCKTLDYLLRELADASSLHEQLLASLTIQTSMREEACDLENTVQTTLALVETLQKELDRHTKAHGCAGLQK